MPVGKVITDRVLSKPLLVKLSMSIKWAEQAGGKYLESHCHILSCHLPQEKLGRALSNEVLTIDYLCQKWKDHFVNIDSAVLIMYCFLSKEAAACGSCGNQ